MPAFRNILIAIALAATLIVLGVSVSALWQKNIGHSAQKTTQKPPIENLDFKLVDENNQAVALTDYGKRFKLVYFGFTYCPDVCPTQLSVIANALDEAKISPQKLQPLFISLDAERDSPALMKEYTAHFHPNIIGLTGSAEQIKAAAKRFKVYYNKVEDESSSAGYTIDHSSIVFLLNEDNEFLRAFTFRDSAETIAQALTDIIR
ncbi:MAG: SCO family protein [Parvibaculales bacterium]